MAVPFQDALRRIVVVPGRDGDVLAGAGERVGNPGAVVRAVFDVEARFVAGLHRLRGIVVKERYFLPGGVAKGNPGVGTMYATFGKEKPLQLSVGAFSVVLGSPFLGKSGV